MERLDCLWLLWLAAQLQRAGAIGHSGNHTICRCRRRWIEFLQRLAGGRHNRTESNRPVVRRFLCCRQRFLARGRFIDPHTKSHTYSYTNGNTDALCHGKSDSDADSYTNCNGDG